MGTSATRETQESTS